MMFTVARPNDPTRWSKGTDSVLIGYKWGMKLKHPSELDQSIDTCKEVPDEVPGNSSTISKSF